MCYLCDIQKAIKETLAPIEAQIARIETAAVEKFNVPTGTEFPNIDNIFDITDADIAAAIALWNRLMTLYQGLLQNQQGWQWNTETAEYTNSETNEILTDADLLELRNTFLQRTGELAQTIGQEMVDGNRTLTEMAETLRTLIKDTHTAEYLLGHGGVEEVNRFNFRTLIELINKQFRFFIRFLYKIFAGELTIGQILSRIFEYIQSAVESYEQGRASSRGLVLPAYPGDGTQICLSRCKCHWEITSTETMWYAYWTLNPTAEHCQTCLGNSEQWNPYTQPK